MDKFFNFLGLAKRAGNIVEGYSRCDEQRNKKDFFLIIISDDASNSTRKKFKNHCIAKNIRLIEDFSKEELAHATGKNQVAILLIKNRSLAQQILKTINQKGE